MPIVSSREAWQCLRDAALGSMVLEVVARLPDGQVEVRIDSWSLTLLQDGEGLACCSGCQSPDGRQADLQHWHRYGTNPVDHLSIWERGRIEQLLAAKPTLD
ncbi:DUF7693 family protein [Pseudomonas entomophila]|uniref:DUF7693 family protein n=1 Tax=Pseudomonas entomophila TaxID=312306 RepID=UPI00200F2E06|nr:hypothetical protein [Pseudomonas entomophila]